MASGKSAGVVYVRLSDAQKELLEVVCRAVGVSQNTYALDAILTAVLRDQQKYADVIARQKELGEYGQ